MLVVFFNFAIGIMEDALRIELPNLKVKLQCVSSFFLL